MKPDWYDKMREDFVDDPEKFNYLFAGHINHSLRELYSTNKPALVTHNKNDELYIGYWFNRDLDTFMTNLGSGFTVLDLNGNHTHFDIEEFVALKQNVTCNNIHLCKCSQCGTPISCKFTPSEVEVLEHENCFDGEDYTLTLKVPRNRSVAYSDWLGDVLQHPKRSLSPDVCTEKGRKELAVLSEKQGFVHFYVGNSSPHIYKLQDGTYIVCNTDVVLDENEELDTINFPGIEEVGNIITDLRWCTFSSLTNCKAKERAGLDFYGGDVLEMDSGLWEFTVHLNSDKAQQGIYASIKKVK